jgi:hypothetical protein
MAHRGTLTKHAAVVELDCQTQRLQRLFHEVRSSPLLIGGSEKGIRYQCVRTHLNVMEGVGAMSF